MKKLISILLLTLIHTISHGTMSTGVFIQEITSSTSTERENLNFISDKQTYTTGGAIFTYPTDYFNLPPIIHVSICPTASHPTTEAYIAEITSNTTGATIITVYQVSNGLVSEAANGSVTVYLLAIADFI